MARLINSTKLELSTGWLIDRPGLLLDRDQLIDLDKILDTEARRFRESHAAEDLQKLRGEFWKEARKWTLGDDGADTEADRKLEQYISCETEVVVEFTNGARVDAKSFDEVCRLRAVEDLYARKFTVKARIGRATARLEVCHGADTVRLSVTPDDVPEASDLFVALRDWFNKNRPNAFETTKHVIRLPGLLFLGLLLMTMPGAVPFPPLDPGQLSVAGRVFTLLLYGLVLMAIAPGHRIGIGRAARSVAIWRRWRQMVIGILLLLVGWFVYPQMRDILAPLFGQ